MQDCVSYLQCSFDHEDVPAETRTIWAASGIAIDGAALNYDVSAAIGDAATVTTKRARAAGRVAADCSVRDDKCCAIEDTAAYTAALKTDASCIACDGAAGDVQRPAIADTTAETGWLQESASDEVAANSSASDLH